MIKSRKIKKKLMKSLAHFVTCFQSIIYRPEPFYIATRRTEMGA